MSSQTTHTGNGLQAGAGHYVTRVLRRLRPSLVRFWQVRANWPRPRRSVLTYAWRNPVFTGLCVLIGLLLLSYLADPVVLAMLTKLPGWVRDYAIDWEWVGKGNWMLVGTGVTCLAMLAYGFGITDLRRRVLWLHRATVAGFIFWAVAAPGIVAATAKQAIGRTRPYLAEQYGIWHSQPWSGFSHASMPSGDACNAAALAVALSLLLPRFRPVFIAFAIIIPVGRMLADWHYISDVTAGALLGGLGAYALALWYARHGHVFQVDPDGRLRLRGARIFQV